MPDPRDVRRLFDRIEPSYDRFTRWFSFGMDARWKQAVRRFARAEPGRHLDLACGTGDLLDRDAVGVDFSAVMLRGARRRAPTARVVAGDMLHLPFRAHSADVVTAAYAFRNVADADQALREVARVLRPGGLLVTLDFYRPRARAWRALFEGYLRVAGRAAGWLAHRDPATYGYIAESLEDWMTATQFVDRLDAAGFVTVGMRRYLRGGITLHAARCTLHPTLSPDQPDAPAAGPALPPGARR